MSEGRPSAATPREADQEPQGIPATSSTLERLAQVARAALVGALAVSLGALFAVSGQLAPSTPVPVAPVPAVAQAIDAPEASPALAKLALRDPVETPALVEAVWSRPVSPAVDALASAMAEESADELTSDPDQLLADIRPSLSARGGARRDSRGSETSGLQAEIASPSGTPEPALPSVALVVSEGTVTVATPTPTARPPTKTPTPKPAPTRTPTPRPTVVSSGDLGQRVVDIALRYVGYRYSYGGTSPSTGFDCSGFAYYVYKVAGRPISRDIYVQYRTGVAVSRSSLAPGDLVFFQNTYRAGLSHVAIYIGGGRFVHAQSESYGVTISYFDTYWSSHYLGARRL